MKKVSKAQGIKRMAWAVFGCGIIGISTIGWVSCNSAKADNSAQEAAAQKQLALDQAEAEHAHREALGIGLMRLGYVVYNVDTVYMDNNETKPIAVDIRLRPDSLSQEYGEHLAFNMLLDDQSLDGYEKLWGELIPGSEVQFDFRDNPGHQAIYGYLIPRVNLDSPRRTL